MCNKRNIMAVLLATAMVTTCAPVTSMAAETTTNDAVPSVVSSKAAVQNAAEDTVAINLSDNGITVNGKKVGTDSSAAVYTSNDIIYYENRDSYDSGYPYGEGTNADKHSAEEAAAHTVVNITQPGTYMISGTLSKGQIAVDLGSDAVTDPTAKVTLILNGVDITCTVAPAVIFYNVYECDTAWSAYDNGSTTTAPAANVDQDTTNAGASVILADDSVNIVTGSHVAKIYKDKAGQKKKYKFDAAFYSKQTMNVDGGSKGNGTLNIIADNEGLDTELHLTLNGGIINIQSQDDGINTNEDGYSVTTINGGELHIVAGLGTEGDGIDSNGYLVINGGTVISAAKPASDSGLDSDCGSYINGGYVVATGSTMDWAESDSNQVTMNLQFAASNDSDEAIVVTNTNGKVIFAYDPDQDETTGSNNRAYKGAIISCPELKTGETYYVYVGGTVKGIDVNGLYNASKITGYSGGMRQQFTGTDVGMGGFGGPGGGQRPGGFGGQTGGPGGQTVTASTNFYMTDKVNSFSGVSDADDYLPDYYTDPDIDDDIDVDSGFTDVKDSDWFYNNVKYVVDNGLMVGTSETTFSPDLAMSRAMVWTVLARLDGADTTAAQGETWYTKSREWAMNKIISGGDPVSDGTNANGTITREQLVTMLWRYAGSPVVSTDTLDQFSDKDKISSWAESAMAWAVQNGIIFGTGDNAVSPQGSATRAQAAAILQRYCEKSA